MTVVYLGKQNVFSLSTECLDFLMNSSSFSHTIIVVDLVKPQSLFDHLNNLKSLHLVINCSDIVLRKYLNNACDIVFDNELYKSSGKIYECIADTTAKLYIKKDLEAQILLTNYPDLKNRIKLYD